MRFIPARRRNRARGGMSMTTSISAYIHRCCFILIRIFFYIINVPM